MNKKEKIEQEIDKTLAQFDNAERLPSNPYFYTRVQARLEEKQRPRRSFSAILKPVLFSTLVAINLTTAVWYLSVTSQVNQSETRQELLDILSHDLNLDNTQSNFLIIE